MSDLDAARAALQARQGAGARYDADDAPHDALLLARRGTGVFARKLSELDDAALTEPFRARLVARVSYQARAVTRLIEGAPDWPDEAARTAEIALGATLPARALRHLFDHTAKHLDVVWRDLPGPDWDRGVTCLGGRRLRLSETPAVRAGLVWHAAVALENGLTWQHVPAEVRDLDLT